MASYYVAWNEADNPRKSWTEYPLWFRVFKAETGEAVTELMTKDEALEMLRRINLLDPPAQKELDLWQ